MLVHVHNQAGFLCPVTLCEVAPLIKAMLQALEEHALDIVHLHLVRDSHIVAVNHAQMNCLGPTNVLSFPPDTLMLSLDTLRRECLLYGQEQQEHFIRLLAHGLAHIMGHDHGDIMDNLCMRMEEAGIIYLENTAF